MTHDTGRTAHREIDKRLPNPEEKRTLQKLILEQKLEFIADGNTDFDQDDNWRLVIDGSGNMDLDKRESGSWVNKATWT
jgi:hypothetical protein